MRGVRTQGHGAARSAFAVAHAVYERGAGRIGLTSSARYSPRAVAPLHPPVPASRAGTEASSSSESRSTVTGSVEPEVLLLDRRRRLACR